jgi:rod shape-determining protein MreC
VLLESSRGRAVLAGDNEDRPSLQYLPPTVAPSPGERIVTSGDGGVFPPGLPVGVVASADGTVRVRPFVELGRLQYLRLVDFGLRGVLWPDRRSGEPGAGP